ncbi:hypothetical protein [Blastomonas sp. CCH8-A3]|uniref:hypothetical protein n=1 Tax=Blastomonas sp. CCH8-A3 TaxID=1768743 RepID=UPI0012E372FA|nr:hypothetical protein [Blastomonas sp. CCH8-A3]MBA4044706.1 hypothetical protein [Erythrobacter sp.]
MNNVQLLEGEISLLVGRHDVTDVHVSGYSSSAGGNSSHAHVFVNSSREFAVLFELGGKTVKLCSGDYIAVAPGDKMSVIARQEANGLWYALDAVNLSRGISWIDLISVRRATIEPLFVIGPALFAFLVGIGFLPELVGFFFLVFSVGLLVWAIPKARREISYITRLHDRVDELRAARLSV